MEIVIFWAAAIPASVVHFALRTVGLIIAALTGVLWVAETEGWLLVKLV